VQATQPDQPWPLLFGADADTAPGVGQVAGGPLVVGQPGPGDGGHSGGHALAVSDELGHREAVLAGPLVGVAQPQSLGQQRPLGRQPPGLAGPLPDGGLLRMPASLASAESPGQETAGQGGSAADQGQQQREADEGGEHQPIPSSAGPEGSAAAGDQQPVTAALDQLPVAVLGEVGMQTAGVPAGGAGGAVGLLQPGQAGQEDSRIGSHHGAPLLMQGPGVDAPGLVGGGDRAR
jgi:hypothetical protein